MSEFPPLPDTVESCREQIWLLADDMAAIRTQIATADIQRQAARRAVDDQWFARAKTALRAKQQESAHLTAHLRSLSARSGREGFKDVLIELVRLQFDEPAWAQLLQQARTLHQSQGAHHG